MLFKIVQFINQSYNSRQLKKGKIRKGNYSICGRIKVINSGGSISIGDGCMINSGKGHNPIGGDTICRIVSYGGEITIGERVAISNSTIVSRANVTIEDDVFIGGSCKIYDNDFHPTLMEDRVSMSNDIPCKPIVVKRGAFIGAHCIILKGTTIGEKSVIGAGSVVCGNIPSGEIWGGSPARFIKKLETKDDQI